MSDCENMNWIDVAFPYYGEKIICSNGEYGDFYEMAFNSIFKEVNKKNMLNLKKYLNQLSTCQSTFFTENTKQEYVLCMNTKIIGIENWFALYKYNVYYLLILFFMCRIIYYKIEGDLKSKS